MSERLRVGITPCPNDTFAFHGLLSGAIAVPGLEIEFADVEEWNRRLRAGECDVAKVSFATALRLTRETTVLESGAALGFGVGPLLLARAGLSPSPPGGAARVLCPGEGTTATLLYRMFHPAAGRVEHVVFAEILPALERGAADYGVCIHEGRFVWRERGLQLIEDLGASWERHAASPLPLGGLLARRELGRERLRELSAAVAASIEHARAHPDAALRTMLAHAAEHSAEVCRQHVELYVNEHTAALGAGGRAALAVFASAALAAGWMPAAAPPLDVMLERDQRAADADAAP